MTFDDDESYQEGATRFQHMEGLMTPRDWLDDELAVTALERELADRAPLFSLAFRFWWPAALILILVILFQLGVISMPNESSPPPAQPAPPPTQEVKPLQAAIQRLAEAIISIGTHPDTGMFFFDAQELTVNEKLMGLKLQALVDLLCAKGGIQRYEFENRLEELVLQKAQHLEDGAKRLALSAIHNRPVVKGN